MAITRYTLAVGQVSAGVFVPDESMTALNLRTGDYSTVAYAGTHIDDGVYEFGSVPDPVVPGEYKVYNDTTELTSFGIIKIGEDDAVMLTGAQTIADVKTFSGVPVFSNAGGLSTDVVAEKTVGNGVYVDGIRLKDDLTTSNIVNINGTQTISGAKTFSAIQTFSNSVVFQNDASVDPDIYPQVTNNSDDPTDEKHLCPKFYVDRVVSAVSITPYQQGSNIRRVQYGGTVEASKVYTTIATAIANFGTPTSTSRLIVMLEKGQADSNYSNVYQLYHSTISGKSYISIVGLSRTETHLILGGTGDSASCTAGVSFENMSVYCTTEVSDRVYGSMTFVNCNIYGYKDINFANCVIKNCDIRHASGEVPILSSAGYCLSTTFSQAVTEDTYTGKASYIDSYDTGGSLPTAPNLGS